MSKLLKVTGNSCAQANAVCNEYNYRGLTRHALCKQDVTQPWPPRKHGYLQQGAFKLPFQV